MPAQLSTSAERLCSRPRQPYMFGDKSASILPLSPRAVRAEDLRGVGVGEGARNNAVRAYSRCAQHRYTNPKKQRWPYTALLECVLLEVRGRNPSITVSQDTCATSRCVCLGGYHVTVTAKGSSQHSYSHISENAVAQAKKDIANNAH